MPGFDNTKKIQLKNIEMPENIAIINIIVITKNSSFYSLVDNSVNKININGIKITSVNVHAKVELLNNITGFDNNSVFHFDTTSFDQASVIEMVKTIRKNNKTANCIIVVWANKPWSCFDFDFLVDYEIYDLRTVNYIDNCKIPFVVTKSIAHLLSVLQVLVQKQNLEKIVQERTETLTVLNKKFQAALVQNSNVNTKLHQQRIQIEKQSAEIIERNNELEKAFKKSSLQQVKLQKVLMLNEKHRAQLEKAIDDAKLINEQLQLQNEEILAQKEHIETQREELEAQRDLAIEQHTLIKIQQDEINDNIRYARHIQTAMLPPKELMSQLLPKHFVFNKPKDIVSGDFYWVSQNRAKTIIVVADCTGHGISGAMMSMLGVAFLNEIVNDNNITSTTEILELLRSRIIASLHQQVNSSIELSHDGMDITICIIDIIDNTLEFSGANNPMYLVRDNQLIEFKPDKMPIGIHEFYNQPFTSQHVKLKTNDTIYMFSDGYRDQFGGPAGKKLKSSNFKNIILNCSTHKVEHQDKLLENEFTKWRNGYEQIDDVLVLGFSIT